MTFANGSVVYRTTDGNQTTCIDALKDDAHYRFSCRCGCGAEFAGYGRDIKATGKIGRAPAPAPTITTNTPASHKFVLDDKAREAVEIKTRREETAEKPRPYVSDRFLMKAQFDLSDDEIDAYRKDRPDPLESMGVDLAKREPPAIGAQVYSLSTGAGPFSLVDHVQKELQDEDGTKHKVLCGLLRNRRGKLETAPLADLDVHQPEVEPVEEPSGSWLLPVFAVVTSSLIGSAVSIAYFWL